MLQLQMQQQQQLMQQLVSAHAPALTAAAVNLPSASTVVHSARSVGSNVPSESFLEMIEEVGRQAKAAAQSDPAKLAKIEAQLKKFKEQQTVKVDHPSSRSPNCVPLMCVVSLSHCVCVCICLCFAHWFTVAQPSFRA
jgi:hypothetical protein